MAENKNNAGDFLLRLQKADENERLKVLDECVNYGASIVKPLAETIEKANFEVARMAKRCLWKIVRYSGKPGNDQTRKAVCEELTDILQDKKSMSVNLKREIIWMLSEVGDDNSIPVISEFLKDRDLRDDARCALQRIPSDKALEAIKKAFQDSNDEFKFALADSLRARGFEIKDPPSRKLIPTKQTNVGKKG